jgi:hypothetical protein
MRPCYHHEGDVQECADGEPDRLAIGLKVTLEFRQIQKAGGSGMVAYGYEAAPES